MYGNRTEMHLREEDIDRYILGYIGNELPINEKIDRSIIRIPNSNCVRIYNKYQEEAIQHKLQEKTDYPLEPLAIIPELDITLYSRCLMCRIDDNDNLLSMENEDYELITQYFSE